jgi:hypothetical protein
LLLVSHQQLAEVGKRAFEERMVAHLRGLSSPLYKAVGEAQLSSMVKAGIPRAAAYGLTFRGPVRLYLELMLLFGSHFDTDPQYPWGAEILKRVDAGPQMQRADLLYRRTLDYRKAVAGLEDVHTFAALRRIRALVRQPPALTRETFIQAMAVEIVQVYPQKAAFLGAQGVDSVVRAGILGARELGLTNLRGFALMTMLVLAFGHGCARDPVYEWVERVLKDPAGVDSTTRDARLEAGALAWLEQLLTHVGQGPQL